MTKPLYVGCRVRILYSIRWPELNGTEGTIIDRSNEPHSDWLVSCDLWGSEWEPGYSVEWVKWGYWDVPYQHKYCFGPKSEQLESLAPSTEDEQESDELIYIEE